MKTRYFHIILISILSLPAMAQQQVKISHRPETPLIETVDGRNVANFDLIIENTGKDTLSITKILMKAFDSEGNLVKEKFLDANGTAPSIAIVSKRELLPMGRINVFNPFPEMPANSATIELTFTFNNANNLSHTIVPKMYSQPMKFIAPVKGRTLVYDGHDANAHHRRFDYEFAPIRQLGFTTNFMRYAYDFVTVDANGKANKNTGDANADWFSFGGDILDVADGTIESIVTTKAENREFDMGALQNDKMELFGNYVIIKHANNLYSIYGHMKQASSKLKAGDKVAQGQKIGEMGASGSAFMPHLHFEMRDGSSANAEGVPSYFSDFTILLGSEKHKVKYGTVNTGDIFTPDSK